MLGRVIARREPLGHRWHAVPSDLGRGKPRAEAFHRAFVRWLGPGELVFTQRSEVGREAGAAAAAEARDYDAAARRVWV
jgi:hypothetical protein